MERLFNTHYVREQECLDGLWAFQTVDVFALPKIYTDNMAVPACWEMSVKYCRYTGCAAYRRTVYAKKDGNLRFVFKGVSHTCRVYLDGAELGGHYSAYSAFSVVAYGVCAGEHTLEVLVDNAYGESSKLHMPNDYFTYGGITRPVFMEYVDDVYIERTEFEPHFDGKKWSADVRVFLGGREGVTSGGEVSIECAGEKITLDGKASNGAMLGGKMSFENVLPWSTEDPSLYELKHTLIVDGKVTDDLVDRAGFRTVAVDGKKFLLNGKSIYIKGVNRHEDHGSTGCAIPLSIMYADISLIRDLGANAVRTSHYQNDERFLDLCDENGILVWEESHARSGSEEHITSPLFIEQSMNSMHEMLEYHYNHPSIIMWGCLNEAASHTDGGYNVYKQHLEYLATDKSRIVTFASDKHAGEKCFDYVDICSTNIYPIWYSSSTTEDLVGTVKNRMRETGNSEKPIIISEYGAGAIAGFHDVMRVKWSEEHQCDVLEEVTEQILADSDICGLFVWQFCDTRIKWTIGDHLRRPGSRNNKGLVDEFRRPKAAYYTVKRIFEKIK